MGNLTTTGKLTARERERAALVDPKTYPQDCPCVNCKRRWMQHKGMLCPTAEGYISYLLTPDGSPIIVPPTFGDSLFVPDEDYYKEPDFHVV